MAGYIHVIGEIGLALFALAQIGSVPSETEAAEILVVGQNLDQTHVRFSIDKKTRAVKCRPANKSVDPVYANLKCEAVRRCAQVEPYSRKTIRACLDKEREKVALEYVRSRK